MLTKNKHKNPRVYSLGTFLLIQVSTIFESSKACVCDSSPFCMGKRNKNISVTVLKRKKRERELEDRSKRERERGGGGETETKRQWQRQRQRERRSGKYINVTQSMYFALILTTFYDICVYLFIFFWMKILFRLKTTTTTKTTTKSITTSSSTTATKTITTITTTLTWSERKLNVFKARNSLFWLRQWIPKTNQHWSITILLSFLTFFDNLEHNGAGSLSLIFFRIL